MKISILEVLPLSVLYVPVLLMVTVLEPKCRTLYCVICITHLYKKNNCTTEVVVLFMVNSIISGFDVCIVMP
jgi:hypothetical protein